MTTTSSSRSVETRDRLLDAAERRFAECGFAGASVREITSEAEANLSAVSYHFGSKEELFVAVVARVMEPINRERIEMLDRAEAEAAGAPIPVETLIEVLVGPVLRSGVRCEQRGGVLLKLFARAQSENVDLIKRIIEGPMRQVKPRIEAAMLRALPHLTPRDFAYRMHFVMGAAKSVAGDPHMLRAFSQGLCDPNDIESTMAELVRFLAAGMRAGASSVASRSRGATRAATRRNRA